jgi:hypothetical protein
MSTTSFPIPQSSCLIPATAQAYSLNITVIPPGTLDYLTVWPTGSPMPVVSTLNDTQGDIVANAAIVPAGTNGAVSVFVYQATDVVIDINGYFLAPPPPAVTPATTPGYGLMLINGSLSVNTAAIATLVQIENDPNFCNSANGTTGYGCKLPNSALLNYQLGQAFLLRVDTTCATTCTLAIDSATASGVTGPIPITQADGMTAPNGTLMQFQPRWVFFDGMVFRLI